MTTNYVPPLHVHLLCRAKEDSPAGMAAAEIERLFEGTPLGAVEPLDIPTFRIPVDASGLPCALAWDEAARHALVIFVDDDMFDRVEAWSAALDNLVAEAKAHSGVIIGVTANAATVANLSPALAGVQVVRVPRVPADATPALLATLGKRWASTTLIHLLRALADRLQRPSEKGGTLFISHAKVDGAWLAEALRDFSQQKIAGATFFDAVNLRAGDDFEEQLREAFNGAVVVVLQTDNYAGRYWCNWEVVTGKFHECPFLTVDLLTEGEARSLRYAGNARTMRWPLAIPTTTEERTEWLPREHDETPQAEERRFTLQRIFQAALAELVRRRHDYARLHELASGRARGTEILRGPPELATLPAFDRNRERVDVIHPDPPLPVPERELMRRARPDVRAQSLTESLAGWAATATSAPTVRLALSISDAPDLASRGLTAGHLNRLWARMALQFLLAGAKLGYGGDLRKMGYTELLRDLLMSRSHIQQGPPTGIVGGYLGWPNWITITPAEFALYPLAIRRHPMLRPTGLTLPDDANPIPNWSDPEHQLAWTVGMRAMRERMAADHDARVLVGGQYRAVSPIPGLVDEVTTFLDLEKPVFLLGGFGGMTSVIARAISGETPLELTREFQDDQGKRTTIREYIANAAKTRHFADPGDRDAPFPTPRPIHLEPPDFEGIVARLNATGIRGLNNGLTNDENGRLFRTRDPVEALSLVLRGLTKRA